LLERRTPNHEQGKHSLPGLPALQQYRMALGTHRSEYINQYHTARGKRKLAHYATLMSAKEHIVPLTAASTDEGEGLFPS
jgi:hypothetical protein